MLIRFSVNYRVILEKLIAHNMLSSDYFSHGKRRLATQNKLAQCSWICKSWIPHDLLIAKLEAYGLDKTSLHLLRDYLGNRKQRTKIGSSFSDLWDIICRILQGSVLGPLFLDIFINDMLFFVSTSNKCNFADDNILSFCGKMLGDILHNLKFDLGHILKWFKVSSLKPNPGKFQFPVL